MNCFKFRHLAAEDIPVFIGEMYDILYQNMNSIAPTGNTYEEDFGCWSSCVEPVWKNGKRLVILIFSDDTLCGFFQYCIYDDTFRMDEIQFRPKYHGSGLFAALYHYLTAVIPAQTKYVDAFSRKENLKSQGILKHLGLEAVGESKNGNSLYFKGDYQKIFERYL